MTNIFKQCAFGNLAVVTPSKSTATLSARSTSWRLPHSISYFTGRAAELDELSKILDQQGSGIISQALAGKGGVGKSALGKYYAHQSLAAGRYDFVVWMTAHSSLMLMDQFKALAKDFGLPQQEILTYAPNSLVAKVFQELSVYANVLLVYDNTQDHALLQGKYEMDPDNQVSFLPADHSITNKLHWVVITQNQNFSQSIPTIKLGSFSKEDARHYIHERLKDLPNITEGMVDKLAHKLGYFPLALTQAAALIRNYKGELTIEGYLELYDEALETQRELLSSGLPSDDPYKETVYTTWNLSINALQTHNPLSVAILNVCAYFASDSIPIALICTAFAADTKYKELQILAALNGLLEYSLIDWEQRDNKTAASSIDIHQLVQTVVRLQLSRVKEELITVPALADAAQAIPLGNTSLEKGLAAWINFHPKEPPSIQDYKLINELIPHGEALAHHFRQMITTLIQEAQKALLSTHLASLLVRLGKAYRDFGNDQKAYELFLEAYQLQEKYSTNILQVAMTLRHLANANSALGKIDSQKEMLERALEILQDNNAKASDIILTKKNLANACGALNDNENQHRLLKEIASDEEALYGRSHLRMVSSLRGLAHSYGSLGDFNKQCELLKEVLVIYKREGLHWFAGSVIEQLTFVSMSAGDIPNALEYMKQLEKSREQLYWKWQLFSETNQRKISPVEGLQLQEILEASTFQRQQYLQYQALAFEKTLMQQENDGSVHIKLARIYYQQNNSTKAIDQFLKALACQLNNDDTRTVYYLLSRCYHVVADITNAEKFFLKALQIEAAANIYCDYGIFLFQQGNYPEAIEQFKKVIAYEDESKSIYEPFEKRFFDSYLQQEFFNDEEVVFIPALLAYYFLLLCYEMTNEKEAFNACFNAYVSWVTQEMSDEPVCCRILSYNYSKLNNLIYAEYYADYSKIIFNFFNGHGEEEPSPCLAPDLFPQDHIKLARFYYQRNDSEKAINCLERALLCELTRDDRQDAYHLLARCSHIVNDIANAQKNFLATLQLGAAANIHCDYGLFLFRQKDYPAAIDQFLKAIEQKNMSTTLYAPSIYEPFERYFFDSYLQQEFSDEKEVSFIPKLLAYHLSLECYEMLNEKKAFNACFNAYVIWVTQKMGDEPACFRFLSYAYSKLNKIALANNYANYAKGLYDFFNNGGDFPSVSFPPELLPEDNDYKDATSYCNIFAGSPIAPPDDTFCQNQHTQELVTKDDNLPGEENARLFKP